MTAPCKEALCDNFDIDVYNPAKRHRGNLIKAGIVVGVGALLGFVIGRWWGVRKERKAQRRRYDSDRKVKRRHAREWQTGNLRAGRRGWLSDIG